MEMKNSLALFIILLLVHSLIMQPVSAEIQNDATPMIVLGVSSLELAAGETYQMTWSADSAEIESLLWESGNPEIASVNDNGLVTACKPGKTVVTASSAHGVSAECSVEVFPFLEHSFTLDGGAAGSLEWSYTDGVLTITGNGSIPNYDGFYTKAPWTDYLAKMHTVIIGPNVNAIGNCAFYPGLSTSAIKTVIFQGNMVQRIGSSAFAYSELQDVFIPDSVRYIEAYAFRTTPLREITIPANVERVANYAFYQCLLLSSVTVETKTAQFGTGVFDECRYGFFLYLHPGSTAESYAKDILCNYKYISERNGWAQINGNWYYFISGIMQTGWFELNGNKYYFDQSGVRQSGIVAINGIQHEFDPNGKWIKEIGRVDGWKQENGKWYYYTSNGFVRTGWLELSGKKYYLNPEESGAMAIGKVVINGAMHEFSSSGVWLREISIKNGWKQETGKWYYYKDNIKQTGWLKAGINWYFLNSPGGDMHTGWYKSGANWYYLQSSGIMATGTIKIGTTTHRFTEGGVWQGQVTLLNGWKQEAGKWYYYKDNVKQKGWLAIGGRWYFMNRTTSAMQTGWLKDGSYWYYFNNGGDMRTGWMKLGSNWYYMGSGGKMQTGWLKNGNNWFYLNTGGNMHVGWLKQGSAWYYLKDNGTMAVNTMTINGARHQFNSGGVWLGVA